MELWTGVCPGGNATDPIWRVLASSQGISSWTPLKPQHSISCWQTVQWKPSACRSCQCFQKKGIIKSLWGGFVLSWLLPLGTLSLRLWVIALDPDFIAGHQNIKNSGIWIDQLDHLPAVMTSSFLLIYAEPLWDELRPNFLHLHFLVNNCVYTSHTAIKKCAYCLYRHTTVFMHELLYFANQHWCSDFLTPPTPLIIPHRLSAFLESLMPLKNWCSIHARCSKHSLNHSICFFCIFSKLKQNFIAYRSSKVSSRPDCIFEIHQLWQSGFSRVYSNCFCSCSFEAEIIKIGQSSHKLYGNNILNFQESTTILNACTKKGWKLIKGTKYFFLCRLRFACPLWSF